MTCYGDSPTKTTSASKYHKLEIMIVDTDKQINEGLKSKNFNNFSIYKSGFSEILSRISVKGIFLRKNLKESISLANINVWINDQNMRN